MFFAMSYIKRDEFLMLCNSIGYLIFLVVLFAEFFLIQTWTFAVCSAANKFLDTFNQLFVFKCFISQKLYVIK